MNACSANRNLPQGRGPALKAGRALMLLCAGVMLFAAGPGLADSPSAPPVLSGTGATEDEAALDRDFRDLANPDYPGWERAQADIRRAWSRSGSPAMDLLLQRGEKALDSNDTEAATEHLTALTDHAPDFAAGWVALASAHLAAGLYGPATLDLARALRLEPRQWEALSALGSILEGEGEDRRALAAFRASFALNPHQPDVKDAIARLTEKHAGTAL